MLYTFPIFTAAAIPPFLTGTRYRCFSTEMLSGKRVDAFPAWTVFQMYSSNTTFLHIDVDGTCIYI